MQLIKDKWAIGQLRISVGKRCWRCTFEQWGSRQAQNVHKLQNIAGFSKVSFDWVALSIVDAFLCLGCTRMDGWIHTGYERKEIVWSPHWPTFTVSQSVGIWNSHFCGSKSEMLWRGDITYVKGVLAIFFISISSCYSSHGITSLHPMWNMLRIKMRSRLITCHWRAILPIGAPNIGQCSSSWYVGYDCMVAGEGNLWIQIR